MVDNFSQQNSSKEHKQNLEDGLESQQCKNVTFGNFSTVDASEYFSYNGVKATGVEFLCDTFNATKCWVEEGSKHTFSYMEQIDLKEKSLETQSVPALQDTKIKTATQQPQPLTEEKKPSSWASLFSGSAPKTNSNVVSTENGKTDAPGILSIQEEQAKENTAKKNNQSVSLISMANDDRALKLAESIAEFSPNFKRHQLQLRGLVNRGNWCYINTTLQALLGIPAITHFYKFLKIFMNTNAHSTSTPLTDSMITFFNEFEPINPKISLDKQSDDLRAGTAFEPKCVYDVLLVLKTTLSEKGRQEDAEEFLSFLLNGIHDELVDLKKLVTNRENTSNQILNGGTAHHSDNEAEKPVDEDQEESWEQVGKKNKSSTLRKAVIEESLIKHVFGGVLRSSVHQKGKKESTTLQPFFTLQLDIQGDKIWSLKDALEAYFVKENLQGFTCTTTNTEVEASRRTSLEELPLILIFHLKYFVFDRQGGCQKLHKPLDIPVQLEISKDILSVNAKSKIPSAARDYKLCSVVYHHGKHAAGGHYTACVHHGNPFGWVHFDDNQIKSVNVQQVLKHQQGCVPYLLFYERTQAR